MRLRLLVLLLLSLTLAQQIILPKHVPQIGLAAQKPPKNDTTDYKETKQDSSANQYDEQGSAQQDTSASRTVFNNLVETLVSWIPRWPFLLAGLLLLGLLADRICSFRRSKKAMDTIGNCFDALDKEMNLIKRSLADLSTSLNNVSSQVKSTFSTSQAHSQDIASFLNKAESRLEKLPLLVCEEIVKHLDLREKIREEEEKRNKVASLYATLAQRIEALSAKFPIVNVALATSNLLSSLRPLSRDWDDLSGTYVEYMKLGEQWEELKGLQPKLLQLSPNIPFSTVQELGKQLQAFEEASEELSKKHRITWFTTLLNEASRYPIVNDQVSRLLEILNIEEIPVEPGTEVKDRTHVDIAITEGGGDRAFIKDILEKGYVEKTSRLVLKSAKVTVRLD